MKDVEAGHRLGPFPRPPFPNSWCDSQPREVPLGSVQKSKWISGGKRRLISDFKKAGHNQAASPNPFEGTYFQVRHLIMIILTLGAGCTVVQFDVESAIRTLTNTWEDLHLHNSWTYGPDGARQFFVDLRNPFGQIEAENNFQVFGGILEWIFQDLGAVFTRRYVDNFFDFVPAVGGLPDAPYASRRARWWKLLLRALDVPYHEFAVGTTFHALGWIFDTVALTMRMTPERLTLVRRLLAEWCARPDCTLNELEAILGLLFFVASGFWEVRPFLGRLLKLKSSVGVATSRVRRKTRRLAFSKHIRFDFNLLRSLMTKWNGTRSLWRLSETQFDLHIWTDASSSFGCGAYCTELKEFYSHQWTPTELTESVRAVRTSMPFLELRGVFLAVSTWAESLRHRNVAIFCDNAWVVNHVNKGFCREEHCLTTIRLMFMSMVNLECNIHLFWLDTDSNLHADLLSKGLVEQFLVTWTDFSATPPRIPSRW
jgi:hypothetical protein